VKFYFGKKIDFKIIAESLQNRCKTIFFHLLFKKGGKEQHWITIEDI
jgi:hypothetical protein